jgi:aspartate/glutamate racemase
VHTVTTLHAVFQPICSRLLPPDTDVMNLVDDSLLQDARSAGGVTPQIRRRLACAVWSASDAGAQAVLVTCSSMGDVVDDLAGLVTVPVLRVDDAMAEAAVQHGNRIGVAATLSTTLEPTMGLVRRKGDARGRTLTVRSALCDGAFDAARAGDIERHDELIREAVSGLAREVDVVILAQASMARALASLESSVPILTSPELAVASLAASLNGRPTDG